MKFVVAALLLATSSAQAGCKVEAIKWDQGRSGTSSIKVQGVSNCSANAMINATFYCDGEFLGTEMTFIRPGGGFRMWPDGYCGGELDMKYVITE